MAKQKSTFKAIIYEKGDNVICMYCDDVRNRGTFRSIPQVIIDTNLIMNGKTQLIKFSDKSGWEVSNHYIPYGETIEKYKEGLVVNDQQTTIIRREIPSKGNKINLNKIPDLEDAIKEVEAYRFKIPRREVIENSSSITNKNETNE